jgi:hypothetical protein
VQQTKYNYHLLQAVSLLGQEVEKGEDSNA